VVVLEGGLEVDEGGDDAARTRLGPGALVGGIGLLGGEPAPERVLAAEPSTLLEAPYPELRSKLELDVGFAARFYRAM
jgi:CRP-like cAMP-binding protein